MGKGGSVIGSEAEGEESLNSGESPWPSFGAAERRVLDHQRKLHRWARTEPARRFGDLFNLIYDRATLLVAWDRVAGNKGAMTSGVDKMTRLHVETVIGVEPFLEELRGSLKDGTFTSLPVRQTTIPKRGRKVRSLGIPTLRDRVVQMAVKLILEPVFEVDAYPSSYGYRPGRRAQDAIAEIHHFTSRSYEWVVKGDIQACFDNVDHQILIGLVQERITDRKVLRLVRALGSYKNELIRRQGPWRDVDHVEVETLNWVDWFIPEGAGPCQSYGGGVMAGFSCFPGSVQTDAGEGVWDAPMDVKGSGRRSRPVGRCGPRGRCSA